MLRLIAGVAEALQAVHREGIVHRDLKPANVLLAADGPRVIDFGVARAADSTSLTQSGTALGTVAYMAPEQVLGGEAAPSADVFALGQIAVFAATGGAGFGDGDPHAVLYRVVHAEPDLSRVPAEIQELVARCLRKPAAERPTVEEVIRAVQEIQAYRGDEARYASGAWLPGELAAGIEARAAGADQARGGWRIRARVRVRVKPPTLRALSGQPTVPVLPIRRALWRFPDHRSRRVRAAGGLLPHPSDGTLPHPAGGVRPHPAVPHRAARTLRHGSGGRAWWCVRAGRRAPAAPPCRHTDRTHRTGGRGRQGP